MIGRWFFSGSLRGRILFAVSITVTIMLMFLSTSILYRWRTHMLNQELANAEVVTKAFSVAVTDALIFEDQELYQAEGFIDNYVGQFMQQNPRLLTITVLDTQGNLVARSWQQDQAPWISGSLHMLQAINKFQYTIAPNDHGVWVLETVYPLETGQYRWGTVVMAVEVDSLRQEITQTFILMVLLAIVVTSMLLLLLWVMLGQILGSLHFLVQAMDETQLGAPSGRRLPRREDEIGVLFHHFHSMQDRLSASRRELLGAEQQVYHAERLAAIGRLASGFAHEINNPINGIRSCIYAIKGDLDNREQTAQYLDMMDEGLTSAAGVTQKLLGFARQHKPGFVAMELEPTVRSVIQLVSFAMEKKNLTLGLDFEDPVPGITGDPQLIKEVIMNLTMNAIDAVPEGGHIAVVVGAADPDHVFIEIRDNGSGIPANQLGKIFDPFFTTKETGKGTGLGLSISLGIAQAHGGDISVASTPDGTTFRVTLPLNPVIGANQS